MLYLLNYWCKDSWPRGEPDLYAAIESFPQVRLLSVYLSVLEKKKENKKTSDLMPAH